MSYDILKLVKKYYHLNYIKIKYKYYIVRSIKITGSRKR